MRGSGGSLVALSAMERCAGSFRRANRSAELQLLKRRGLKTDGTVLAGYLKDALTNRPSPASTQSALRNRRDGSEDAHGHTLLREQACVALLPIERSVANAASGWAERHASSRLATLLGRSVSPATCAHVALSWSPKHSLKTAAMARSSGAAFLSTGGGVVGAMENHLRPNVPVRTGLQRDFRLPERHRGIRACTTKQPSAGLTRSRPGPTPLRGMQWRAPMVRFIACGHGCRRYKGGTNQGLAFFPAGSFLQ